MVDTRTPIGFSDNKEDKNYFQAAINQFWEETGMDTDTEEIRWIINWFDAKRNIRGRGATG